MCHAFGRCTSSICEAPASASWPRVLCRRTARATGVDRPGAASPPPLPSPPEGPAAPEITYPVRPATRPSPAPVLPSLGAAEAIRSAAVTPPAEPEPTAALEPLKVVKHTKKPEPAFPRADGPEVTAAGMAEKPITVKTPADVVQSAAQPAVRSLGENEASGNGSCGGVRPAASMIG